MPCLCHRAVNRASLYTEAATVGLALIPMYYLVSRATTFFSVDLFVGSSKQPVDLFLSGALFHLLAEESGVNEWYLTNSHAAQKIMDTVANDHPIHRDLDWLRTVESLHRC